MDALWVPLVLAEAFVNNELGNDILVLGIILRTCVKGHSLCHYLELWSWNTLLDSQKPSPISTYAPNHSFHGVLTHQLEPLLIDLEYV